MKKLTLLFLITLLSCNQTNDDSENANQLRLEISAIEKTNQLYRNNVEILKAELPKTFESNENILLKIMKFKIDLRENRLIEKSEIDGFLSLFLKFENYAYFPKGYLHLLKNSKTPQNQYKYIMLIENYLYQAMYNEHQGSFIRFNYIIPFIDSEKEIYRLNEDVKIRAGFFALNSFHPYTIEINNQKYKIDEIEEVGKPIILKADKKGNNRIEGIIKYEKNEIPFFVNFEVE